MGEMKFLEKLLDGVGVEWKALKDIGIYVRGLVYNKSSESSDGQGYKVLRANNITLSENSLNFDDVKIVNFDTKVKKDQKLRCNDILISAASGSREHVGKVAFIEADIDYYFGGFMGVIRCSTSMIPRYAFHILTSQHFKIYLDEMLNSSTINNLNSAVMGDFKFPIPCPDNPQKSLEIQAEIVRILDAMTAHTAELTAELTARKKQYDYYRDKLLSFEEDVYEFPLTDICTSIADGDHQAPPQTSTGINFVTISNISKNGFIDFSKTKYVPDDYYKNLASKRKPRFGDVLYTVVGSIGIPVFIDFEKEFTFQRHVAILRFKTELVNPKYVFHFMRSRIFFNKANSVAMGAAQKTITLGTLGKLKISLPSLERQNNIVAILDKFDSLANSITDGLPREIELRQKQYAYYRDLLLSFPAAQAV